MTKLVYHFEIQNSEIFQLFYHHYHFLFPLEVCAIHHGLKRNPITPPETIGQIDHEPLETQEVLERWVCIENPLKRLEP